jgi:hypothetical protein
MDDGKTWNLEFEPDEDVEEELSGPGFWMHDM